jgi:very-short-patch-repair endonuclease
MACGLSAAGIARRLSGARLFRVMRSVYSPSPCIDEWGRRWAAVLATQPERAVLSHWSAGEVHQMLDHRQGRPHVIVPGGGRRGAREVVVHRSRALADDDVVLIRGLRVTTPERTVLDVAGSAADEVVLRMIREGEFRGVLGAGAIRDSIANRSGHRGLARLRRVDPATVEAALGQTPLEDELDPLLVGLAIPGLVRQHWLQGLSGAWYRVDFAYPDVRLAIEADGRTAHQRASDFEKDRARDADLGAVGWQALRFTRIQVRTAPETVRVNVERTVHVRRTARLPDARFSAA